MRQILSLVCLLLVATSCGEYYRMQKSTDVGERYSYAKKYYNEKKYSRVVALMEDILTSFTGTSEGAQAIYLVADSYYNMGREEEASKLFQSYYNSYPKGRLAEEARFKAGYCLYRSSPDPKLDQGATLGAIRELQLYLDFYSDGQYADEVRKMLFELQDKLAYKEYLSAQLYYNLGTYLGNNYQSAVITAQNALKDYPYTKHKEDLLFLVLRSKSEEAINSVLEKQQERLREAADYYYGYVNEYPEGRYLKDARRIYEQISKRINND